MGTRGFDLFGRSLQFFSTMGVYPSFFFSLLLAARLGGQETHCKALSKELNTDPVDLDKFRQDSLAAHNSYRAKHGVAALKISAELNALAQEWAEKLIAEIKDYTYGKEPSTGGSEIGHFTQVVWKGSTEVGVGVAQEGSTVVVVANYSPPGNVRGQYAENVPPPQ